MLIRACTVRGARKLRTFNNGASWEKTGKRDDLWTHIVSHGDYAM